MATSVTRFLTPERAPKSRIAAFPGVLLAALALGIALTGVVAFQIQQGPLKERAKESLARIADVKVERFTGWLRERRQDGYTVSRDQFFGESAARWLESGARADAMGDRIEHYLSELITAGHFDGVVLFDGHGEAKLAVGQSVEVSANDSRHAADAFRSDRIPPPHIVIAETQGARTTEFNLYVPLLAAGKEGISPVAVVLIRINAPAFLYPLIQEWPTASAGAEALLVQREADQIVYLTGQRGRQDAALSLKLPHSRQDLPAAMAVSGRQGVVDGVDYRGVAVVAALRNIPDSPWQLVAKIDASVAYAPVRKLALTLAAMSVLAYLAVAAPVLLWWRAQRALFRAQEAEAEAERLALVRHFDFLSKFANDAIVLADEHGKFVEVNDRALSESGYTREELLRMNARDLLAAEDLKNRERNTGGPAPAGRVFDTVVRRKDGSTYPVEISARTIEIEGHRFNQYIARDITERKRVENALLDSEQNYRTLADSAPALIWASGTDKLCNYFNQPWLKFTGRTLEQELGDGWTQGLHPDDFAQCLATYLAAFDRREPFSMEYRLRRHDGEFRWVRDDGRPRYDSNGEFIGYLGYVMDVTGRKQVEEALRRSEKDLKDAQHLARIGSWDWDARTDTITWSDEYYRIYGFDPAQRPPGYQEHLKAYTPESAARLDAAVKRNTQTGESYELELELARTEGPRRWIAARSETKRDARGQIVGLRGTAQDITERKRAEEERRAAALYARSLIEASLDPLVTISPAGKITDVSKATEEVTGLGRDHLVGTDFADYFTEPDKARAGYRRVLAEGYVRDYPLTIRHSSGRTTDVLYNATVYRNEAGELQGVFAAARDITERKRAERERLAHLRFVESMNRVHRAMQGANDLEQMMSNALNATFSIFDCDRAWLLYPCDPEAPSFRVPMEITKPEYPGAKVLNVDVPMSVGEAQSMQEALDSDAPVTYTAGTERPVATAKQFGVQSQMFVPVHPKSGKPWVLGMHQCSYPRIWTVEEKSLLQEIGRRLADGLTGMLMQRDLRKSEERYRTVANFTYDWEDWVLPDGSLVYVSPSCERITGYRVQEFVNDPALRTRIVHPDDRERVQAHFDSIRDISTIPDVEELDFRIVTRLGQVRWIAHVCQRVVGEDGKYLGRRASNRDITEKMQAERALRKVNRTLRATSECNMALIHAASEAQLLNDICRIIVDAAGYRLAWVGYAEQDTQKTVRPVAHSGYEPGYMEHTNITWADDALGQGPLGIAIRSGQIQVVQDVNTDPRFEPWRANAARLGYGSLLVAPLLTDSQTIGTLSIYAEGADAFDSKEIALLGELAGDMAFGIVTLRTRGAQKQSAERLLRSMEATIEVIAGTVEKRDPYTAGHQLRVAELGAAIAHKLGLGEQLVNGIRLAGMVHDLGKVQIPAEILSKPGTLTPIEFEMIKGHPAAGYEILKGVDFPWPIAQIVYQHHERLDGSGYPRGLKADEILLEARILSVADVVEAMASHRPYRPARGIELALQEIGENAGKYYDADVVQACTALFRENAFAFKV